MRLFSFLDWVSPVGNFQGHTSARGREMPVNQSKFKTNALSCGGIRLCFRAWVANRIPFMSQLSYQLLIKLNGYNYIWGGKKKKRVVNDCKKVLFPGLVGGEPLVMTTQK